MSKNSDQDIAYIRALAELLKEMDLTEIEVGREFGPDDELNVRLSRAKTAVAALAAAHVPGPAAADPAPAPVAAAATPAAQPDLKNVLTSPMVGTAYLAPEPGADHFVKVGDAVAEGQTVLIIEAMKTMNQINSPRAGTVKQILVANAEPVEFGHPLMVIE